jgi:hypothetical protein
MESKPLSPPSPDRQPFQDFLMTGEGDRTQCCQMFLCATYQNGEKMYRTDPRFTKWPYYQMAVKQTKGPWNIPNGHKIFQMAVKQTIWP